MSDVIAVRAHAHESRYAQFLRETSRLPPEERPTFCDWLIDVDAQEYDVERYEADVPLLDPTERDCGPICWDDIPF